MKNWKTILLLGMGLTASASVHAEFVNYPVYMGKTVLVALVCTPEAKGDGERAVVNTYVSVRPKTC